MAVKEFIDVFSPMGMTEACVRIDITNISSIKLNHTQEDKNTKVYYFVDKGDAKQPKNKNTVTRQGWLKLRGTIKNFKSDEKYISIHVSNQLSSPFANFTIMRKN